MTDDTIRDPPQAAPEGEGQGKALVWVMLVLAGFAALGTVMSVIAAGSPGGAIAQAQLRDDSMSPALHAALLKEVIGLTRTYAPWIVATGVPYALATLAIVVTGIGVVRGNSDRLRRALMVAALAAAVARVGVGLVTFNVVEDSLDLVSKVMEASPHGPPSGDDRSMKRAVSLTDDIATTMTTLTTVAVALFWLITGLVVAPRREDEATQPAA